MKQTKRATGNNRKSASDTTPLTASFFRASLDALSSHIAILDETGTILMVNKAWKKFAKENGYKGKNFGIGTNYLTCSTTIAGVDSVAIDSVTEELQKLLSGKREEYHTEYPCHSDKVKCWFMMRATRFQDNTHTRIIIVHENVTEIKHSNEHAESAQKRLQSHFDQTPIAVIEWDKNFRVVNWNLAAESIFGYTKKEVLGKHAAEVILPKKFKKRIAQESIKFLRQKKGKSSIAELMTKDGKMIQCEIISTPIVDATGDTVGAASLIQDISERIRTEENLYQLASIVESSDAAIVSLSLDGTIESWNKGAANIYGYAPREAIGENFSLYVPKEKRNELKNILHRIKKGEHLEPFETSRLRKDGKIIDIFLTVSPRYDMNGELVGTSHVGRDITKRKAAELALAESENRYRSLISALHEGIVLQSADGVIQTCNKSACSILGLTMDQLLGKSSIDSDWYTIHEDGSPFAGYDHPAMITLRTGKPLSGVIMGVHKPDGTLSWISINSQPLYLQSSTQPSAVVTSFNDITAQKNAEKSLEALNKQLQRSNNELQDFASVASHDLQEPLRKIQAFGDRLQLKHRDTLSDEAKDCLDRMQNAAARMQRLINDLLVFSRVTTKVQPYQTVDLHNIITEVLSDLEITIEQKKATIILGNLPKIEADPLQMRQLFQNLISNSLKFQKKNQKPTVTIKSTIQTLSNEKVCTITVADNGIGFDTKYLYKIFSVFQRLHTQHEFIGTGVGLAVCRKIAERHHGTITAESSPGKGATFIITLPIRQVRQKHDYAVSMTHGHNPLSMN